MFTKSNLHCNTYTPNKRRIITVFAFYLKVRMEAMFVVSGSHSISFCTLYC